MLDAGCWIFDIIYNKIVVKIYLIFKSIYGIFIAEVIRK